MIIIKRLNFKACSIKIKRRTVSKAKPEPHAFPGLLRKLQEGIVIFSYRK